MKTLVGIFIVSLMVAARPATTSSPTQSITARGYYFAIVYNNNSGRAQFSSTFFSNCDGDALYSRISRYAGNNNYTGYKLVGPFAQDEVESAKTATKQQWVASGYTVGGDNNFVGDCY